ncbi:hypothetical protein C5167_050185 [Papaver somniferum]|uniref:Uncharacterized protein n=1 Tax=Papaver somniferum TaxID=3469 RepID=A0A4Y7KRV7_PAPSO|nr:hypothetical protein C5167_050185 [Papaver somniferum]
MKFNSVNKYMVSQNIMRSSRRYLVNKNLIVSSFLRKG